MSDTLAVGVVITWNCHTSSTRCTIGTHSRGVASHHFLQLHSNARDHHTNAGSAYISQLHSALHNFRCIPLTCVFRWLPLARLAQSAERKALNLVVVDSSPTVGVSWICGGSCVADHLIRVCGQLMRNLQHGQHWHTHNRNVSIGENCARCVTSSSFGLHAASVISSYILSSVCSFFFITKI